MIGRTVTVLDTITGPSPVEIGVKPGSDLPLHASAQGKIALAFSRRGLLTALRRQKLTAMTDRTVTDIAVLEQQVAAVRVAGWAGAYEEMMLGINGIAVPVFDEAGECVASLAVVGSIQFVPEQPGDLLLGPLIESGNAMSTALGYRP